MKANAALEKMFKDPRMVKAFDDYVENQKNLRGIKKTRINK